jgi:hypothetical protein
MSEHMQKKHHNCARCKAGHLRGYDGRGRVAGYRFQSARERAISMISES